MINGVVFQRGGTLETDLCVATGLVTETGDEKSERFVGDITPDIELIVGYVKICCKTTESIINNIEKFVTIGKENSISRGYNVHTLGNINSQIYKYVICVELNFLNSPNGFDK